MWACGNGTVRSDIRPEHIVVSPIASESAVPAMVNLVEDLGNELLLDLRVDDQPLVARLPAGKALEFGESVWLEFPSNDLYFFGPGTENRV